MPVRLVALTAHVEDDFSLQVLPAEDAVYEVEQQAGTTAERQRTRSASQTEVCDTVLRCVASAASPLDMGRREAPVGADGVARTLALWLRRQHERAGISYRELARRTK